jgi:ParB family chromosome partitioning protein
MKKSKNSAPSALGRGLGALLGEIEEAYDAEIPQNSLVLELPLSEISVNPFQPRKTFDENSLNELADSIKNHGLLQPIVVKEDIDGYILIAGERRLRASKKAKLKTIRAVVSNLNNEKMRHYALIENIQRDELNAIEMAYAYKELMKVYDATHDELSSIVYKSRTHITNTLRLLQLFKKAQTALIEGKISAGHAKILVTLNEKEQAMVVDTIVGQRLSVRDTETLVKQIKSSMDINDSKDSPIQTRPSSYDFETVTGYLQDLGYKTTSKSNKITIEFKSEDDVVNFYKTLQNS